MVFRKKNKAGMMTVEILIALFLWAIFFSGIASLWFSIFSPNIPLLQYVDQENFFVRSANGLNDTGKYIDRGVKLLEGPGGLTSVITEWQNAFGQKACRGIEFDRLTPVNISTPIELDGFNIASSLLVRGKYIYLSTNSSSTTDPDLYILSINKPIEPIIISKINTGPGLVSLSAAGYVVYAANTSINSQAQAVDISDPYNPTIKWSFKVPGSQGTSTALGKAVVSNGNVAILGTAKNASSEIYSLDAETGQLLADTEVSAGVNGLFLDSSHIYASTPINPEISVFDITDLRLITTFDAPGGSGNGKPIDVVNDRMYLGRTLGGNELMLLNSVHASSTEISKLNDAKIGATVDSIIAANNTLLILTGHSQKELQVWKTEKGTDKLSLSQTIDLPTRAVGIGCSSGYVFVALMSKVPILIFKPV